MEPEEWILGLIGFISPCEVKGEDRMDYNQQKGNGGRGCVGLLIGAALMAAVFLTVLVLVLAGKF